MKNPEQQKLERDLQNPLANREVPEPAAADKSRADSDAGNVNGGGSDTARHYNRD